MFSCVQPCIWSAMSSINVEPKFWFYSSSKRVSEKEQDENGKTEKRKKSQRTAPVTNNKVEPILCFYYSSKEWHQSFFKGVKEEVRPKTKKINKWFYLS